MNDINMMLFNSHATISDNLTFTMRDAKTIWGFESTGANTSTLNVKGTNNHIDAPDVFVLTTVNGTDEVDRVNRIAGIDAMVAKANVVNKQGFVVAFSEIENVKPGGITGIAVTIDS